MKVRWLTPAIIALKEQLWFPVIAHARMVWRSTSVSGGMSPDFWGCRFARSKRRFLNRRPLSEASSQGHTRTRRVCQKTSLSDSISPGVPPRRTESAALLPVVTTRMVAEKKHGRQVERIRSGVYAEQVWNFGRPSWPPEPGHHAAVSYTPEPNGEHGARPARQQHDSSKIRHPPEIGAYGTLHRGMLASKVATPIPDSSDLRGRHYRASMAVLDRSCHDTCPLNAQRSGFGRQALDTMVCPDLCSLCFKPAAMCWCERASKGLTLFGEAMENWWC